MHEQISKDRKSYTGLIDVVGYFRLNHELINRGSDEQATWTILILRKQSVPTKAPLMTVEQGCEHCCSHQQRLLCLYYRRHNVFQKTRSSCGQPVLSVLQ